MIATIILKLHFGVASMEPNWQRMQNVHCTIKVAVTLNACEYFIDRFSLRIGIGRVGALMKTSCSLRILDIFYLILLTNQQDL